VFVFKFEAKRKYLEQAAKQRDNFTRDRVVKSVPVVENLVLDFGKINHLYHLSIYQSTPICLQSICSVFRPTHYLFESHASHHLVDDIFEERLSDSKLVPRHNLLKDHFFKEGLKVPSFLL